MIASAGLRIHYYDAMSFEDGFYSVFSLYLIFFGLLLVAAEQRWIGMLKYFEFLTNEQGKAIFMIFIGALLFDSEKIYDLLCCAVLEVIGHLNCLYLCIYNCIKDKQPEEEEQISPPEDDEEFLLSSNSDNYETLSERARN
jgi:hypothetical protein